MTGAAYVYYIQNMSTLDIDIIECGERHKAGDILPPQDDSGCLWRVLTALPQYASARPEVLSEG